MEKMQMLVRDREEAEAWGQGFIKAKRGMFKTEFVHEDGHGMLVISRGDEIVAVFAWPDVP